MKIPKISRRFVKRTLLILLGCFLVYFILLVVSYCIPDPEEEAMAARFDALIEYRMQEEPRSEPTEEIDNTQLIALDFEMRQFRQGVAMVKDTGGISELSQVLPGAFEPFQGGEVSTKFPLLWPYAFSGSSMVIGNALSGEPVVAFYNPYFDVAVLTQWKFETTGAPGFKLKSAYPVTGRAIVENRASLATDMPIWNDYNEVILETRFVMATKAFTDAFEATFAPAGRTVADLSSYAAQAPTALANCEDRVFFAIKWVIDAQNPDAPVNYAGGIKDVRKALSAPLKGNLELLLPEGNPQDAEQFFVLDQAVREGMQPYMVMEQNVIFVNPLLVSSMFISVHFVPGTKEYKPALVALFSLDPEDTVN